MGPPRAAPQEWCRLPLLPVRRTAARRVPSTVPYCGLNYATANLEAENNDYCKYTDIYKLIQSEFGGIAVENGRIIIRGGKTSFTAGSSHALIIVDGHPNSDIGWIRPCNVKSVDILKGSEGAIYGARGGNGVVVISTK